MDCHFYHLIIISTDTWHTLRRSSPLEIVLDHITPITWPNALPINADRKNARTRHVENIDLLVFIFSPIQFACIIYLLRFAALTWHPSISLKEHKAYLFKLFIRSISTSFPRRDVALRSCLLIFNSRWHFDFTPTFVFTDIRRQ